MFELCQIIPMEPIDCFFYFSRDARWDIVGRALKVLEEDFTKKIFDYDENGDDIWQSTIISVS